MIKIKFGIKTINYKTKKIKNKRCVLGSLKIK